MCASTLLRTLVVISFDVEKVNSITGPFLQVEIQFQLPPCSY